ncbi:hypothetical protein OG788_34765 [Streptomyces sp. NBC_00647]|uniref:hypothetical protein n=1 Tax=Streptomyces sp. NBC_00647 TaxID=2975796 RepID=UPI00324B033C
MAVEQLPGQVLEFARYLNGLVERLDQSGGWCGVFWQRDPDGMRACLQGWEVPPWDVVEALLQDVGAEFGERAAAQETQRARGLHDASLAAYDARPGGRDALGDRLDVMLREQRYAAERQAELGGLLHSAASREQAETIRLDLAWAQDDHERATARCTELRHRIDSVDRRALRTLAQDALSFPAPGAVDGAWAGQPENWADPSGTGGARRGPETGASGIHPSAQTGGHDTGASSLGRTPDPGPGARPRVPGQAGPVSPPVDHAPGGEGAYIRAAGHVSPDGWTPPRSGAYAPVERTAPSPGAYAPRAEGEGPYAGRANGRAGQDGGGAEHDGPHSGRDGGGVAGEGGGAPRVPRHQQGVSDPIARPEDVHEPPERVDRSQPAPERPAPPAPKQRSKRRSRGSARFAGMAEPDETPTALPETAPVLPAPAAPTRRTPRGARFAGAAEEPVRPRTRTEPVDEDARRLTADTVGTLTRLRGEGRSGEAHALLVEAAYWPAARFPLLAAELHRAGLDADWATLLWEAASLPADRLVAAADALTAAGRTPDGRQMLRQGVSRPAPEIGAAVLDLVHQGRRRELDALLDAYVRVRAPEEAARSAEADPHRLVPLLLEAARSVSDECHWDLLHALRVAGLTA